VRASRPLQLRKPRAPPPHVHAAARPRPSPANPLQGIQTEAQTIDALQQAILATINTSNHVPNLFAALHTLGAEHMPLTQAGPSAGQAGASAAAAATAATAAAANTAAAREAEDDAPPASSG
jgi:hypothetical protein